ncbi:hypothetical protein ACQ4PT_020816 [Festuca glaucescens]
MARSWTSPAPPPPAPTRPLLYRRSAATDSTFHDLLARLGYYWMRWETAATGAEAEALQERIWDLHDKLSHAILSLSARAGHPGCGCRAPNGHVVIKGRRPGGCPDLAAASAMVNARGLHAIRAALEDLEGHLHFLHVRY